LKSLLFRELNGLFRFTTDHFPVSTSTCFIQRTVCYFVPFQEQRYFRVFNAAKRSCKFG